MTIVEELGKARIEAMKAKDTVRLMTVRSALADVTSFETSGKERKEATDVDVINILRSAVKKREKTAEEYDSVGATERAEKERAEVAILEEFLPTEMNEDKIRELVREIVIAKDLDGTGGRGMGVIMKELKTFDNINPGTASKIVKEELGIYN